MDSHGLSLARTGTIINYTSKNQEKVLNKCIESLSTYLIGKYDVTLIHQPSLNMSEVVSDLNKKYGGHFSCESNRTFIKPDGGILNVLINGIEYPILITEVKNQGTNDKRIAEGKKRQAQGNAVERLSKNLSACQTWLIGEDIFPFVGFGFGCDFKEGSSIRDRLVSMNHFGELNRLYLFRVSTLGLQRASLFFREAPWAEDEIFERIRVIAEDSLNYYMRKYGK